MLTIRTATEADEEPLYRMLCNLENEVLDRAAFGEIFRTNFQNPDIRYLVAEWDGTAAGMGSCHVQPLLHHAARVAEIQEMYVEPSVRSKGIGKVLVDELVTFARSRGALNLEVTSNQARVATHRFYEREGFLRSHFKLVRRL